MEPFTLSAHLIFKIKKHGGLHLLLPDGWSPVTCHGISTSRCHQLRCIAVGRCFHWGVRPYICGSFPTVHRVHKLYIFLTGLSKVRLRNLLEIQT